MKTVAGGYYRLVYDDVSGWRGKGLPDGNSYSVMGRPAP
jgi:hypothetical protein